MYSYYLKGGERDIMDSFVLAQPCKQLSPGFPGLGLPVEKPYLLLLLTRDFEVEGCFMSQPKSVPGKFKLSCLNYNDLLEYGTMNTKKVSQICPFLA